MVFRNKIWSLRQTHTNQIIRIDPSESSLVGRKADAKICLKTYKVSRSHATLMINGEGNLMIMDLKSINGTYVNGHVIPVHVLQRVHSGDIISFGLGDQTLCENDTDILIFFEVLEQTIAEEDVVTIDLADDEPENSVEVSDSLKKNVTNEPESEKSSKIGESSSSSSVGVNDTTDKGPDKASCSKSSAKNSSANNVDPKETNTSNTSIHKLDLLNEMDEYIVNCGTSKESPSKENNANLDKSNNLPEVEEVFQTPKKSKISKNQNTDSQAEGAKRTFTTWHDNSIVIELSDDEDVDFSASQIFQTSQVKKEGQDDEVFQKIKTELAEMDFCSEEIVSNHIPIDLEEDGFENTQQICAVLQDEPSTSKAFNRLKPDKMPKKAKVTEARAESRKSPRTRKKEISNGNTGKETPKDKDKITPSDDKSISSKRRHSVDKTPVEKKKAKASQKTPPTLKDMKNELKRRHSTSKETHLSKDHVENIRDERRKKLKELAGPSGSGCKPSVKESGDTTAEHSSSTDDDIENGIDPLKVLNQKKRTSLVSARQKSPATRRTTKVIESPPALAPHYYNLRRTKSSNEIKIPNKNQRNGIEAKIRHSTHITSNIQPEPQPLIRTDPRLKVQSNDNCKIHPPVAQVPNCRQPNNQVYGRQQNIWDVQPVMRRPPRRLSNLDDIIRIMVLWLPNWLNEQNELDISPPINNPPARRIPIKFQDFAHYYSAFSKLILLEIWQFAFSSYNAGSRDLNKNQRRVCIDHVRVQNGNQMTVDCSYYITKEEAKRNQFFKADDFITFECVAADTVHTFMQLSFAVVLSSRKIILRDDKFVSVKPNLCSGTVHAKIEMTLTTRYYPGREVKEKKWPMLTMIANVKSFMMHIRAVKELEQSPLCRMIINPNINDFKFTTSNGQFSHVHLLNAQQKTIVLEAVNLCTGNKPGIYCVKGPPGTGKSSVIVSIILEILMSHYKDPMKRDGKPPMILLSAPSNAAVDNVILKINKAKLGYPRDLRQFVKLVRIGPESSISRDVSGYSLSSLTEQHLPLKNINIPVVKAAMDSGCPPAKILEAIKSYFGEGYSQEVKACENLMIKKCNIICTTLNSCINGRLIDCVNKGIIEFSSCIIDEATQCHEPESLLPTILGIDKFVLVGDPQQLNATIMNNDASRLGFQNSLFSRLANNFGTDPRSPIKLLTDQYRMHPEICAFPNKQFYSSKLRSFPNPPNKFPPEIRPYLVFNCEKISYSSNDYVNMDEVILIKKLLVTIFSVIDRTVNNYSIGIITPYNAQKDLLLRNISDIVSENCKILVNTVDSFQGSEKDIIIISFVRHKSNSFLQNENRLNVALTRAKQALYIIGNYTLFKECKPLYDLREDAKKRKVLLDIRQDPRSISNFQKYLLQKRLSSS